MAGTTGLEPATSDVTGRRSNQLSYVPALRYNLFRLPRPAAAAKPPLRARLPQVPSPPAAALWRGLGAVWLNEVSQRFSAGPLPAHKEGIGMNARFCCIPVVALLALLSVGCSSPPPTAQTVLDAAGKTMGNPAAIRYTGNGISGFYGQALLAGKEWPRRPLSRIVRTLRYTGQLAASDELTFSAPVFGGQDQATFVNGDRAWSTSSTSPTPTPQLAQAEFRQLQIWLSPHGFLRAAAASPNTKLTANADGSFAVTFTALNKYKVTGTIAGNVVTRVATQVADSLLGDTELTATYSAYKTFGPLQAPTRIVQTQGGFPLWDLTITAAEANPAGAITVPDNVAVAPAPSVEVISTRLAPGVWYLTGGSHYSLAVEFPEYIAIVEAPLGDARSAAVIAEVKKVIPGKPISYVVSTHHHFDHAGGLRAYVAEGATIVTHASNKGYYEKAFLAPSTIAPDAQSSAMKKPKIEAVGSKWVLRNGGQALEVYSLTGDNHTDELLIAYLPGPRILMEADSYTPQAPPVAPPPATEPIDPAVASPAEPAAAAPLPAPPPPPNALALWENIERLRLPVRTIAPVHGYSAVPWQDFARFIGK
jgi:glyoxylase-like metal-dependent hydrolase (beta-lactamase superfamily II)